jgi:hypothetical protein
MRGEIGLQVGHLGGETVAKEDFRNETHDLLRDRRVVCILYYDRWLSGD